MAVALPVSDDRRSRDRLAVDRHAVLRLDGTAAQVVLEDLTAGGCRFSCKAELPLSAAVSIGIAGVGHTPARIAWRTGSTYGCAFDRPLPAGAVTAAAPDNIAQMAYAVPFGPPAETVAAHALEDVVLPLRARVTIIAALTGTLWSAIIGLVRSLL